MSKTKQNKTAPTNHKQPKTANITEVSDNKADDTNVVKVLKDKITKLWIHGFTNQEIMLEANVSAKTVYAYVRQARNELKSMPVDMLKSKAELQLLKYLMDNDTIHKRYSIELVRLENSKSAKDLDRFITIAKALESQAKTLTDCLVRMGVVRTPEKGKGTQYPHSPNDINSENLSEVKEKQELIEYHERRLRALKRKKAEGE